MEKKVAFVVWLIVVILLVTAGFQTAFGPDDEISVPLEDQAVQLVTCEPVSEENRG